jgi:hypothetical protein
MNSILFGSQAWTVGRINNGHMKQTSVYDFYTLGQALHSLRGLGKDTTERGGIWTAHRAHEQLLQATQADSVLLPATRDAARKLIAILENIFGDEIRAPISYSFGTPDTTEKLGHRPRLIDFSIETLETVFRADLPRMTVLSVEHKGIYQTERLIDQTDEHFPESIRKLLPAQAKTDIVLAGKCLAFDVHTASAFHMWRALEIVIGAYYVSITGKTFEDDKVSRNWGAYIKALNAVKADIGITGNLDHIRSAYRNPIMHPNVNVTRDEAFSLLGIGISAITQVMQAIDTQPHAKKALA